MGDKQAITEQIDAVYRDLARYSNQISVAQDHVIKATEARDNLIAEQAVLGVKLDQLKLIKLYM